MPRISPIERLHEVAAAAMSEFGRLGYRGTKTADVAAKAGISTGSLFNYVESKEALFHLVFLDGFDLTSEHVPDLPIATPAPGETLAVIRSGLAHIVMPTMRAALLETPTADIDLELRCVLEERYALLDRYWPLIAVIERCAVEMPELEAAWFDLARAGSFDELSQYLERRMAAGLFRPMPDVAVVARIITESLSWFAWHRREGRDATCYDDEVTRRTVVEFMCAALIPPAAP